MTAGPPGESPTPRTPRASEVLRRSNLRLANLLVQFGSFVVILGIPDGLVGVLWPSMRRGLHLPLADLGELVLAGTVLYFTGGLVGDIVRRAIGFHRTLLTATVVGLASLTGWAAAPAWWAVLVSFSVLGLVKGVLDAVLNAEAAIEGGVRRLGLLHGSWAIGGTLGPVIVAALVSSGHWRIAVAVVAGAAAVLVPLAIVPYQPQAGPARPAAQASGEATGAAAPTAAPRRRRLTRREWVGMGATTVAFLAYTAAEAGPISWGTTYLLSDRHLGTTGAALAMALFWAALTVGRLALALPNPFAPAKVLEASCWLFMLGLALFWLLPGRLGLVGLPIAGLGSATIFPLYVALTPDRLGEAVTGRAVGLSIAGAAVGGPVAVASAGLLAAHDGTSILAPFLFGAAVLMYLAHRLLALVVRRPRTAAMAAGGDASAAP
jgi:fucose permease